ncbi:MAG: sodium-dependent transporter [Henriciella sp.]|jgi:NSS family neurotransmitter:Na+ symporter
MEAIGRKTENWGSKFGFIMAAVGSSVGLGNFWRFPFTAGENGGAAFILIYILCVFLFGLPVLMAEYGLGRKSGMSAVEGIYSLSRAESRSPNWGFVGWIGSLAAFFILTFYVVISAWIIMFVPQAFSGGFSGFAQTAADMTQQAQAVDADAVAVSVADVSGANFGRVIGDRGGVLFCLFLFVAVNTLIVARGIRGGIERAATILMPAFFILLLVVVGYAMLVGDVAQTVEFLLTPDFSAVGFGTILAAVGQAFFSISVGSCMMITYGAYLSADTNIPRSSAIVASSDTLVALIAGFAIFPIVFAFGADPAGGPGLFFVSLPIAFGTMPGGEWIGTAFFVLALFAALTSSISLMEVAVSWFEERQGVNRPGAAMGIGFVLFMIGAGYVFSTDYIDFADFVTGFIMLPLCGLLVAWFAGRVLSRDMLVSEFGEGLVMDLWRFACRWIVPPALLFILVFGALDQLQSFGLELPPALTWLLGPNL